MLFNFKLKLKKWRKKIRKTKYLAYKCRLSIYKTEYTNQVINYSIFFNKTKLNSINNYIFFLRSRQLYNLLLNKIKFNLLINEIPKTDNFLFFWNKLDKLQNLLDIWLLKIKKLDININLIKKINVFRVFFKNQQIFFFNIYKICNTLFIF